VAIIAVQILRDLVSILMGHFVRGATGVTIAGGLLFLCFATGGEGLICTASSGREMTQNSSVQFLIWLLIAAP
jgi:hypothetical protein